MSTDRIGGDVGVVFVSYRSRALIEPHAARLTAAGASVVVVDNAGDLGRVGDAVVVDAGGNVGFGAACNLGVSELDPEVRVVCFHNPDVDASARSIEAIAGVVRDGAAIVGPAVVTGERVRARGFHYPSWMRELALARRAARVAARPEAGAGRGAAHADRGRRFASGALLAVDRATFAEVGGFDETYFLYAEDLDLWHRIRSAGRGAVFAPCRVHHAGGGGSSLARGSRELLRWLGVEAFAERFARTGWRPYRAVHRAHAGRIGADTALVGAVVEGWRAGSAPRELLRSMRPWLEAGGWSAEASTVRAPRDAVLSRPCPGRPERP